jgi:hypothetical protein
MNWIKYLALCLPLTLVLVGCTPKESTKTETTESVEVTAPAAETTTEDKAVETTETKTEEPKAMETTKSMEKTTETTKKAE